MSQSNTTRQNSKNEEAANFQSKKKKQPRPPKKVTESYLHNAGLYYLQRFATSSGHFKTVMTRKIDKSCRHHTEQSRDECLKMLDNLVKKFIEIGLLDDDAYARGMVTSLRRRGLSERAIHAKLQAKRLDRDLITQTIRDYDETSGAGKHAELKAALTCAKKKRLLPFNPDKEFDKSLASLGRAGFSYDIAQKVVTMDRDEAMESIVNFD